MTTLATAARPGLQTGTAAGDTVLTYSLQTDPDPLQVSTGTNAPTATVTIVVSNGTNRYVTVDTLAFAIAVGPYAKDLTGAASISAEVPEGWSVAQTGGTFTCTPPDGMRVGPAGLSFQFSLLVNGEVGTAVIGITETTAGASGPVTNQGGLTVAKFPAGLTVSELTASPPIVDPGGSTALSWHGTAGPGVSYTFEYANQTQTDLPATDSVEVQDLQATTTFYLLVAAAVGQQTVQLQRQRTVTVNRPQIVYFNGPEGAVLLGASTSLYWATSGTVARCDLLCDGNLLQRGVPIEATPQTGGFAVTPAAPSTRFELRAYGPDGTYVSLSVTVTAVYLQLGDVVDLGGAPERIAAQSDPPYLFVTDGSSQVIRVDPTVSFAMAALELPAVPLHMALSPGGKHLYLTCEESETAFTVGIAAWSELDPLFVGGYGLSPWYVAFSPDGTQVCFAMGSKLNPGMISVVVYNSDTPTVLSSGIVRTSLWDPPGGTLAYASDSTSVYLVELAEGRLHSLSLPLPGGPDPIPAPSFDFDQNSSIDPCACSLRVAPGGRLYLAGAGNCSTLLVLNPGTPATLAQTLPLAAIDVAFSDDGSQALVVTADGDAVLLDTATYATLQTLALGGTPAQVAALTLGGTRFYAVLDREAAAIRLVEQALC
jgi:hypothetical protein